MRENIKAKHKSSEPYPGETQSRFNKTNVFVKEYKKNVVVGRKVLDITE